MRGSVLAIAMCLVATAEASYDFIPLYERAHKADIIAVGEIQSLEAQHYVLKVQSILVGKNPPRVLRVRRFRDWTCANRGRPYRVGERLLVFLRRSEGQLWSLGAGCEGEVFLGNGKAKVRFAPGPRELSEAALVEAIREFRKLYRAPKKDGSTAAWRRLLVSSNPVTVRMMISALGWQCLKEGWKPRGQLATDLPRLLASSDEYVRVEAARWFGEIAGKKSLPMAFVALRKLAKSGQPGTRLASLSALCRFSGGVSGDFEQLFRLLATRSASKQERTMVSEALLFARPRFPPEKVSEAALDYLNSERNLSLGTCFVRCLYRIHGQKKPYKDIDFYVERATWRKRLAKR